MKFEMYDLEIIVLVLELLVEYYLASLKLLSWTKFMVNNSVYILQSFLCSLLPIFVASYLRYKHLPKEKIDLDLLKSLLIITAMFVIYDLIQSKILCCLQMKNLWYIN